MLAINIFYCYIFNFIAEFIFQFWKLQLQLLVVTGQHRTGMIYIVLLSSNTI